MMKYLLFLLAATTAVNAKYNDVIDCSHSWSADELQQQLELKVLDAYILLIGSPLAFICTMFITCTFLLYPLTRKMPGDIMFFISLSDCLLCSHWFSQAVYFFYYGESPEMYGAFCQTNAFISIFAATGEFSYNVVFCIFLRISISNVLKINKKLTLTMHSLAWIAMIAVPILAISTDSTGLNLFGTCSFRQRDGFPLAGVLIVFIYSFISIYTIFYFKNTVPNNEEFLLNKENFLQYYYKYILASCFIWSGLALSNLMAGFNCRYFHVGWLNFFITIGTLLKLCTPIVLSILRYHDPIIRSKIRRLFRRLSSQVVEKTESVDGVNWLDDLQLNLKYQLIKTILFGIQLAHEPIHDVASELDETARFSVQRRDTDLRLRNVSIDENVTKQLEIQYGITQEDIDEELVKDINPENNLPIRMKQYAHKVFDLLIEKDSKMVDIYKSFDLIRNAKQIESFKGPDGGKGGEFFFFSSDNKLLIKTINEQELKGFRSRLQSYAMHLMTNESVISPIYGIFTFERLNVHLNPKTHIIIMRNLGQINRQYINRVYDIKGSEYDREVLKNNSQVDVSKATLKDVDFIKMEGTLKVDKDICGRLRTAMIRDAEYFKKVGLIDYSLLVMKINWVEYMQDNNVSEEEIQQGFTSDLQRIRSSEEFGIYYHIGIIDYLQQWTPSKFLEQNAKKILNANVHLDTSAQNPMLYANRFIEKVAMQIL